MSKVDKALSAEREVRSALPQGTECYAQGVECSVRSALVEPAPDEREPLDDAPWDWESDVEDVEQWLREHVGGVEQVDGC